MDDLLELLELIELSVLEETEIKNNAPNKIPLNPSAQGWSASAIRAALSEAIVGEKASVLKTLKEKMALIKNAIEILSDMSIEIRRNGAYIQWRYINEEEWTNLYLINSFIGNLDETGSSIDYELVDNVDKSYTEEITSVAITIPSTVSHGFYAGLNWLAGIGSGAVAFTNESSYELKIIKFGLGISNYTPTGGKIINMIFFCDGLYVYCYINEVA
ncbi:MAG: hypothetical protein WC401_05200 [Bacteroidales bacterium]